MVTAIWDNADKIVHIWVHMVVIASWRLNTS